MFKQEQAHQLFIYLFVKLRYLWLYSRFLNILLPRAHQVACRVIVGYNDSTRKSKSNFFRNFPNKLGKVSSFVKCTLSLSIFVIFDLIIPSLACITSLHSSRTEINIFTHSLPCNIAFTVLKLLVLCQMISPLLSPFIQPIWYNKWISMMLLTVFIVFCQFLFMYWWTCFLFLLRSCHSCRLCCRCVCSCCWFLSRCVLGLVLRRLLGYCSWLLGWIFAWFSSVAFCAAHFLLEINIKIEIIQR